MRVRWFGAPWPLPEARAPICQEDRWQVDTPVGKTCIWCRERIEEGDQGVVMAASRGIPQAFELDIQLHEDDSIDGSGWFDNIVAQQGARKARVLVCVDHIDCHVANSLGPSMAKRVLDEAGIVHPHL